ncbi:diguanylate cyclase (GGDEF)-like protein [Marinomonas alcarazii]|uniref:Diguanylate cyclase (GGDEF)-like protein n=1 Tax=Marinomonas alcarazii TaxID=491949 RepID=A0A318V6A4_9GAMM|nr:GGDEF domain-containing response regulator [Marinomonas alcarazii]PYF84342.1 diguanylate cyclase (GGDEF)-like protein [Marinomonas alcarazii]
MEAQFTVDLLEAYQGPTLKLLIVDDDDVDRERLRRMLSKSDIKTHVSEAISVEDSLEHLSKSDFDCVIIDYRLGLTSGLTLLDSIRSTMDNHCAVIMITGLGDEEVAAEAMRLGASDYLLKSQLQSHKLIHAIINSVHRAELEKKLHDMAHYDNLTGLASRPLLLEKLQQVVKNNEPAAVAFLDLDNFKPVNDNYGHETGDYVLVTIANRLKNLLRKEDTLSRMGGDEFVLLLRGIASKQECDLFLNRLISLINTPIELTEFECQVQVSASVGVALVTDNSLDADTILRRADQTMYQAKNSGSNNILFFDPHEEKRLYDRRTMLQAAERGVALNEFELYYQPQIDMIKQTLIGVEALIRWHHPSLGLLYPETFSEALEHPSTGVLIGEWVLKEALKQHAIWNTPGLVISVNIAPAHLLNHNFVQRLSLLLEQTPAVNPQALEIEILETVSMSDIKHAVEVVKACGQLGVHVALDDFGTGYASLSYLKQLPLNTLKIDKSFVQNLLKNPEDRSIVICIVALSQAFNYKLIAEGVESQEIQQALLEIGCQFGQGYFIAKPMPADKMTSWIKTHH